MSNNKRDSIVLGTDPSVKGSPQKHAKGSKQENPFHLLTDNATMFLIFEFIGLHHFRFVAGVSRRWRSLFTQFQRGEYRNRVPDEEVFNRLISTSTTSTVSIAESVSRAQVFLDDAKKRRGRRFRTLCVNRNNGFQNWREFSGEKWPDALAFLAENVGIQHCLEVLHFAISNGHICDQRTLAYAAGEGQLETVKLLRDKGCPWDDDVFQAAVNGNHEDVVEWLEDQGCPRPEQGQCGVCGDTGPITSQCGQCGEDSGCYYL